ncbi:MAG TPA: hypothetical protein PKH07_00050 [bacterium]|nr:hypothetical protein [bacterium]
MDRLKNPLTFTTEPSLKRIGFYLVFAFSVSLAFLILWSETTLGFIPVLLFLIASLVLWIVILRWQIRADEKGIAVRKLLSWDWWRWEDFENGRIYRSVEPDGFIRFTPDLRIQHLSFAGFRYEDRELLMSLCLKLWKPPAGTDIPKEISVWFPRFLPKFLQTHLCLSPEGLRLTHRGRNRDYLWNDVQAVMIGRSTHNHQNFRYLLVALPDRVIRLSSGSGMGSLWSGSVPEWIVEFLSRHVPEEKRESFVFHEPPINRQELEGYLHYRAQTLASTQRDFPYLMIFFVLPVLSFPLLIGLSESMRHDTKIPIAGIVCWLSLLALAALILFLFVPWQHRKLLARERARLENLLLWINPEGVKEASSERPETLQS